MAAALHKLEQRRLIDSDGIADGASIFFYLTGTSTLAPIYSDAALASPLANPVVVGAGAAVPDIYLDTDVTYRRLIVYLDGSTENTDPWITDFNSGIVTFTQDGVGAVPTSLEEELRSFTVRPEQFGATGVYAQDATPYIQAAIEACPEGGTVEFGKGYLGGTGGDYRVTGTLNITKHVNLVGNKSRIVGVMADSDTDLLNIAPTAEVRGMSIRGLVLGFNSGGRDAIRLGNNGVGILNCIIEQNTISGGSGWAINCWGIGTHFNTIRDNFILGGTFSEHTNFKLPQAGGLRLACADRMSVYDNLFAGIGCGILVNLVPGAYRTRIYSNGIVSRDVGVFVARGQKVDITQNTFEQASGNPTTDVNQATYKAHVVLNGVSYGYAAFTGSISGSTLTVTAVSSGTLGLGMGIYIGGTSQHLRITELGTGSGGVGTYLLDMDSETVASTAMTGTGEPVQRIKITKNNYNPSARAVASVALVANVRDTIIDGEDFNTLGTSGADIQIIDASVVGTKLGTENDAQGPRTGALTRGVANTVDPKTAIVVSDAGTSTYGYTARKVPTLLAGYTGSSNFSVWVDEQDQLQFEGSIDVGAGATVAGGTVLFTLDEGKRPPEDMPISMRNSVNSDLTWLTVKTDGTVISSENLNVSSTLYIGSASPFTVRGRTSLFSTPF